MLTSLQKKQKLKPNTTYVMPKWIWVATKLNCGNP